MILLLALLACSTPSEAPKPAPVATPAPTPPAMEMAPGTTMDHDMSHAEAAPAAPDPYAGIVGEMRTRQANIAALLAAGKLKDVHPEAKVLMDLAVALPAKAPAAGKATASLKALDLKQKADELHDKADGGDAAGAKAAFEAVSADIEALGAISG